MMQALYTLERLLGTSSPTRFSQLFFPAVYSCNCYEPDAIGGNTDSPYSKGKWMLPSIALLRVIYGMVHASRSGTNQSPNASYANENPTSGNYPLFANLLKRYADVGETCPVAMPTNSLYWSVTENSSTLARVVNFYNGNVGTNAKSYTTNVVRPVAAFTFTPSA